MHAVVYIIALVLSLPNLIAGLAVVVVQRAFTTRNPLFIVFDFLEGVVWGVPALAAMIVILLIIGCFAATRPYAAVFSLLLNLAAVTMVLMRLGPPPDLEHAIVFLPLLIAVTLFAGLAWAELPQRKAATSR